ncbi:MAG: hypothetical protein HC905_29070 [Bacteroidales bacterium]|nr:hypothetical protein [Bacteroidales bacterium]
MKTFILIFTTAFIFQYTEAQRKIISLNGTWDIEASKTSNIVPKKYGHKIEVPSLINTAVPAFNKVGQFHSVEYVWTFDIPTEKPRDSIRNGVSYTDYNYFFYRRKVSVGQKTDLALLKINRAFYTSAVWINGDKVGEDLSCITSVNYDISKWVKWNSENEIVIRVGAHPDVLPAHYFEPNDPDKKEWMPGLWDDVSLILVNNPYFESVQIAPDIRNSSVVIQANIKNKGTAGSYTIQFTVKEWKSGKIVQREIQ